jgi:hypothetical protein
MSMGLSMEECEYGMIVEMIMAYYGRLWHDYGMIME